MDADSGSTVPRRQLGRYLRQHRETAGITVKGAADDILSCSVQKVWRIEKGAVPVSVADVTMLCGAYRVPPDITEVLVGLAKETRARGWWQSYGDAVPEWFSLYVGLEGAAGRIRKFEPALIPGLLQAHAYMGAVIRASDPGLSDDEVEQRIRVRQERQGLLTRHYPPPPRVEVLMMESVLYTAPGVPGAMAQQLWHLLQSDRLPSVSVRVLPLDAGPHRASVSGAFTILDFPEGEPSTVYSESLTGALYLDRPRELETYEEVWTQLADGALGEQQSASLIRKALEGMDHE